ncbi:MAG: MCE family protein [Chitinophagia bacterium]|nr:MCE family protein [Chitinophagia bacterium]
MRTSRNHLSRLGAFVLAAVVILIASLFLIGRYQHLIGSHLALRARFSNVAGLRVGNNVRYSGIEIGTVRSLRIINDTTVEVSLSVKGDMANVIRRNAMASLGADGLMGNKVVNIVPGNGAAELVQDGDLLASRGSVEIEDVLRTLSGSSENILDITDGLRSTVDRINRSEGLWKLLQDTILGENLRRASRDLATTTGNARELTADVRGIFEDVRSGKGPVGTLLKDSILSYNIRGTIRRMESVAAHAERLASELESLSRKVGDDYSRQRGVLQSALRDTALAGHVSRSLRNVEDGTRNFNEDMEALKHNFLLRGYFRRKASRRVDSLPR